MRNLLVILLAFQLILSACSNQNNVKNKTSLTIATTPTPQKNNFPLVVATTSILCDLTRQIAANTVNVICLIPADINPRNYKPKAEDQESINEAKLILFNGYNLEPGAFNIIKASKNPAPKIAVGERAVPKPRFIQDGDKKLSNPYLWHDAKNAVVMVDIISNNLQKVAPNNKQIYTKNSKIIKGQITNLDKWIKARIATIPPYQRTLITNHPEMGYYTSAYGLKYQIAFNATNNSKNISSSQLKPFVLTIRKSQAPGIFLTNKVNRNIAKAVAKDANVIISERQLFVNNLGLPGSDGDSYQKMMIYNTRTIVEGLGGTFLKFEPNKPKSRPRN